MKYGKLGAFHHNFFRATGKGKNVGLILTVFTEPKGNTRARKFLLSAHKARCFFLLVRLAMLGSGCPLFFSWRYFQKAPELSKALANS